MAKKILIVDDDVIIADMMAQVLSGEGYEAITAVQSLRVYDAVLEHKPDLILLDLMMPYLDGRDELKLIALIPDQKPIPVILVTASSEAKKEEASFRAQGVLQIILKPFELAVLIQAVEDAIGGPGDSPTEQDSPVPHSRKAGENLSVSRDKPS